MANQNIYNINYTQAGELLTPPDKRNPVWLAFLTACLSPIQWLRDLIFGDYSNGSLAPLYNPSHTYNTGDRVVWTDFGVWEYIYATSSSSHSPGAVDANGNAYWYNTQKNLLGLRHRIKITSQKITLEYALNKYFALYGATFVQPTGICNAGGATPTFTYPDSTTPVTYYPKSSIFIGTNKIDVDGFMIADSERYSSTISGSDVGDLGNSNYIGGSYNLSQTQSNFTVWVPGTVYDALTLAFADPPYSPGSENPTIRGLITAFISQYSVYGLTFNVKRF